MHQFLRMSLENATSAVVALKHDSGVRRDSPMANSMYRRFLAECIIVDPEADPGLNEDEMYGVFVSWCFLNRFNPAASRVFWAEMAKNGHHQRRLEAGRYFRAGLRMTGPAAVDYILSSRPCLV